MTIKKEADDLISELLAALLPHYEDSVVSNEFLPDTFKSDFAREKAVIKRANDFLTRGN